MCIYIYIYKTYRGRQYLENHGNFKKTNHRIAQSHKMQPTSIPCFFSTFEKGSWVSVQSAGCRDQPCSQGMEKPGWVLLFLYRWWKVQGKGHLKIIWLLINVC